MEGITGSPKGLGFIYVINTQWVIWGEVVDMYQPHPPCTFLTNVPTPSADSSWPFLFSCKVIPLIPQLLLKLEFIQMKTWD